ncbi:MAG: hypothetical protein FJY97_09450, partial [candidate division Zixibacteria bacterium]|nr:hypothetical protein [candidate division Zixibacteria bacterium]
MTQDPTQNRPMTVRAAPSITIGPDTGDLRGTDDKVLQAGVEYLHRLGGGILRILPGEYTLRNALYLRPNLTIRGSGPDTVLKKAPSTTTRLLQDSDWYESRIRVENTEGFTPGAGIVLRCYYEGGAYPTMVLKDTITAIDGDTISLSHRLTQNMWPSRGATVSTLFALLTAEYVNDVTVENLVLDGNREHNEELNGNYVSGVFIQHCDRYMFRNVTVRN